VAPGPLAAATMLAGHTAVLLADRCYLNLTAAPVDLDSAGRPPGRRRSAGCARAPARAHRIDQIVPPGTDVASRSRPSVLVSRRETCIWESPTRSAIWDWVISS
ncbi:MAG: hypothetical protein QOG57_7028, partial [Pseudonocardiales bacterium]|nr:hypothetical protein [Pseudonocardiales bacterium]